MTSGFDPLPQGEGCRGLVGMLRVDSSLKTRGRGVEVRDERGGRGSGGGGYVSWRRRHWVFAEGLALRRVAAAMTVMAAVDSSG